MNRKATIRRLIGYLKESKFLLLLACITTIVANVLALYGPKLTGMAIDATQGRKTKAVLVMENNQLVLSALLPETIASRAQVMDSGEDEDA